MGAYNGICLVFIQIRYELFQIGNKSTLVPAVTPCIFGTNPL